MSNFPTYAELLAGNPKEQGPGASKAAYQADIPASRIKPQADDYAPAGGGPPTMQPPPQASPIASGGQVPDESFVPRPGQQNPYKGSGNPAAVPSPQISAPSQAGKMRFPSYAELNPEMMGPPASAKGVPGYTTGEGIDIPPDLAKQEQQLAPANARMATTAAATFATIPLGGSGGAAVDSLYGATGRFSMQRLSSMLASDAEAAGPAARVGPFQEWGRVVQQLAQSQTGTTLTSIINSPFIGRALKLTAVGMIAKTLFGDSAAGFVRYLIHRGIFEASSAAGGAAAAAAASAASGE